MKTPKKDKSLVQVTALVTKEEKARLREKAAAHFCSIAHAARMAIVHGNKRDEL